VDEKAKVEKLIENIKMLITQNEQRTNANEGMGILKSNTKTEKVYKHYNGTRE